MSNVDNFYCVVMKKSLKITCKNPLYFSIVFMSMKHLCLGNTCCCLLEQPNFNREIKQVEGWLYEDKSKFVVTLKEEKRKSQVTTYFDEELNIDYRLLAKSVRDNEDTDEFFYAKNYMDFFELS